MLSTDLHQVFERLILCIHTVHLSDPKSSTNDTNLGPEHAQIQSITFEKAVIEAPRIHISAIVQSILIRD